MNDRPPPTGFDEIRSFVEALLADAGFATEVEAERVLGGRNNRVFRLVSGTTKLAVKHYFRVGTEYSSRLNAEYRFCSFCWTRGIQSVPRPFAFDPLHDVALLEWVEGTRLSPQELQPQHVDAARQFVLDINQHREDLEAEKLPVAAEAAFSISSHLDCVRGRIERLDNIPTDQPLAADAKTFVSSHLLPTWQRVEKTMQDSSPNNDDSVPPPSRCLSPSDFGFHNALVDAAGTVRFLDFEYAGWDDPAKLVCDFFSQVDVPVPETYWGDFAASICALTENPDQTLARCELLWPVYRLKWACIVLNEFLTDHAERREFNALAPPAEARLFEQLQKSKKIVASVDEQL